MTLRLVFSLGVLLFLSACSRIEEEWVGRYVVEGDVARGADLRIFADGTYVICVEGCEKGRAHLLKRGASRGRATFHGRKMDSYAREVFARTVGEDNVDKIEGPPNGVTEMNVETGLLGTWLDLEPAAGIIFRKVGN